MNQVNEITGYALPLNEAVALAERYGWRQRVLIYVTRENNHLLVLKQPPEYPYPDAGIQVPAGGLETGETPDQTAVRETFEETGLVLRQPVHLASYHWTRQEHSQVWHYFWLVAPEDTPDTWSHVVTGGAEDVGMTFHCRFAPLTQPELVPNFRYEEALPHLTAKLKETAHD
ncbi:NUDIX hydrolase [Deinococcus koreensis]|uniref:NUDIX hydrolase n=1 Tax=Deinococcus koreensis TaxID=2054903 RepID=A0A2K3UUE3_9DEIO|nr:NUDIX domain-containing protein [Deinococcus koreensis]PNY80154.1 NUDIX hydrolase [Deinococcus koreensis]